MDKSVLLIDDDTVSNFISEKMLSRLGLAREINTAINGRQAIERLTEIYKKGLPFPDIIFLDINMPIMNGFQFIEAFRKLDFPGLEKVKIIIVTSSADPSDIQRAESLGVTDYFIKPIKEEGKIVKIFNFS